jgi:hypothetical protein
MYPFGGGAILVKEQGVKRVHKSLEAMPLAAEALWRRAA